MNSFSGSPIPSAHKKVVTRFIAFNAIEQRIGDQVAMLKAGGGYYADVVVRSVAGKLLKGK